MDQARTITVDGTSYNVDQFSPEIQQAVGIYNAIAADLQKAQLDVIKCQAALQNVGDQIGKAVKAELEKTADTAPVAADVAPKTE